MTTHNFGLQTNIMTYYCSTEDRDMTVKELYRHSCRYCDEVYHLEPQPPSPILTEAQKIANEKFYKVNEYLTRLGIDDKFDAVKIKKNEQGFDRYVPYTIPTTSIKKKSPTAPTPAKLSSTTSKKIYEPYTKHPGWQPCENPTKIQLAYRKKKEEEKKKKHDKFMKNQTTISDHFKSKK